MEEKLMMEKPVGRFDVAETSQQLVALFPSPVFFGMSVRK